MENWVDIKNYEGVYQVSDLGRIRSLDRVDSAGRNRKGRIIKPSIKPGGYLSLNLCKSGTVVNFNVHRLVAKSFLENEENKEQVNHIDFDKTNNCKTNLEWVTGKENLKHFLDNKTKKCKKPRTIYQEMQYTEIELIKDMYENKIKISAKLGKKLTQNYIWRIFGVTPTHINRIINKGVGNK